MKRTHRFVEPSTTVQCRVEDGTVVQAPVVPGILKHPTTEQLTQLLQDPVVLRKYTRLALRRATWSVLRHFPPTWLRACMDGADLPEGRRRALEFVLDAEEVTPAARAASRRRARRPRRR